MSPKPRGPRYLATSSTEFRLRSLSSPLVYLPKELTNKINIEIFLQTQIICTGNYGPYLKSIFIGGGNIQKITNRMKKRDALILWFPCLKQLYLFYFHWACLLCRNILETSRGRVILRPPLLPTFRCSTCRWRSSSRRAPPGCRSARWSKKLH